MAKIGKNYTIYSNDSNHASNIGQKLKSYSNLGIHSFVELENNEINGYSGSIVITGSANSIQDLLQSEAFTNITQEKTNLFFDIQMHYEETKELKNDSSYNSSFEYFKFNSAFYYSFYEKTYENYISRNQNITETSLPNYYDLMKKMAGPDEVVFGNNNLFQKPEEIIKLNLNKLEIIPVETQINKNRTIKTDKYYEKYNSLKEETEIPFYADVKFDNYELLHNGLTKCLQDKKLYENLIGTLLNKSVDSTLSYSFQNLQNGSFNVKELDFQTFINDLLDSNAYTQNNFDWSFLFNVNQLISEKARSFLDVINNTKEYKEVIAYQLAKYEAGTNTLIQQFYIPNFGNETFNYIDTQVKYGKKYTYKLNPIVMTISSKYKFASPVNVNGKLTLNFTRNPEIKIYIFQDIVDSRNNLGPSSNQVLLDTPPMDPEIEFIPYIGDDTSVKININSSIGKKTVKHIPFSFTQEEDMTFLMKQSQNRTANDVYLTFERNSPLKLFEIYRLQLKPTSYDDFSLAEKKIIRLNDAWSASVFEKLMPNKKYYYTIRAVNVHDLPSNPTTIYEVELINDNGLIIPKINMVDLTDLNNNKQAYKEFKQYIQIRPALQHRLVNTVKTDQNNIELGIADKTPWNKTFKLRLTSKSSGKKIDINFKFKYKKPE